MLCHYLLCTSGPKSLKGAPESDGFETLKTYVHWILGRGPTLGESNESHLESSNVKYKMKSCNKMDAFSWAGRAHASRNIMSHTILVYTFSNLPLQKVSKRQVTSVLKH